MNWMLALAAVVAFNLFAIGALLWHTLIDDFDDAESLDRHVSARTALRKVTERDP